uniref:MULE domain-containing protein n=1 Tax=Haemonchus contortus TaxID=6289 RepID=A0A7I4Y8E5_HAECO
MMTQANLEYGEDVMKSLNGRGFGMKRQAIFRAVSSLKDKEVALDNKPEELAQLSDSRTFVHEQDQELHVYYSERTIEMACTNGLYAIAADGVHTKQPKELMQLFCVHGVCNGGVEVPLLYSMTARKTEDVERYRPRPMQPLRIVLDFEKASIAAVHRLFPEAKVEGCAFHLAQAWNWRRDTCNLRKFMQGHGRVPVVAEWWDTIKGVGFCQSVSTQS